MDEPGNYRRNSQVVTASEIAAYDFCPEQWRLQYGLGRRSENVKSLEHGTRFHEKTARAEVASQSLLSLGRILLLVAVLAILAVLAALRMW